MMTEGSFLGDLSLFILYICFFKANEVDNPLKSSEGTDPGTTLDHFSCRGQENSCLVCVRCQNSYILRVEHVLSHIQFALPKEYF